MAAPKGAMDLIYDTLFAALKDQPTLAALNVPNDNIRPNHDGSEAVPGGCISYTWSSAQWLARESKGRGTLTVLAEHPDSAKAAEQVMEQFRRLATELTLTDETKINVALFEEDEAAQEPIPPKLEDKYAVQTSFKVLLTYGYDYVES